MLPEESPGVLYNKALLPRLKTPTHDSLSADFQVLALRFARFLVGGLSELTRLMPTAPTGGPSSTRKGFCILKIHKAAPPQPSCFFLQACGRVP